MVVCEGEPHVSASLFFYLDRRVCWAGPRAGSELAPRASKLGKVAAISDDELARLWHSPRQVFFILEESNLADWQQKISLESDQEDPAARNGTRILRWSIADSLLTAGSFALNQEVVFRLIAGA